MRFLGLLVLALAPVLAILIYFYLKDKFEKEPYKNLILAFFAGVVSTVLPICFYWMSGYQYIGGSLSLFLYIMLGIALVEELAKFIPLMLFFYPSREFNEPYDGIIYGVFVSLGFAAVENIVYVFQFGYAVGVLRAFLAVPGHAIYGAFMGYFIGKAKFEKDRGKAHFYILVGLATAVLIHTFYDYFVSLHLGVISLLSAIGVIIWGMKRTAKHIESSLSRSPFRNGEEDTVES